MHGLEHVLEQKNPMSPLCVLEIGFGTGLNAYLTLLEAIKKKLLVNYVGVEAYPVLMDEIKALNYTSLLGVDESSTFQQMHDYEWDISNAINDHFTLTKQQKYFQDITDVDMYDLIYFDAFGARVQPELWTETIFCNMFKALKLNGTLVTYSAKGSVRRAMQAVGFKVERLPGPPGKREMLRAKKGS
jgi:tRNA U34 5-methylaminomethyl-2-thiouridine-forming methyltransferase MnmC